MTRIMLSSLAVVALLATSATPAASQAGLSGQQPVPCDCTNCSAEHCPKPGGAGTIIWSFQTVSYLKPTWERHLSTGARNPPPPDCPRLYPIEVCRASWE